MASVQFSVSANKFILHFQASSSSTESEESRSFLLPEGLQPQQYHTLQQNAPPEIRKLLNRNFDPSQFSDDELLKKTGLTRTQFAERVELFLPAISISQLLGPESQVLPYYTKKRHNHSFDELAIEFNTNPKHISAIFWQIAHFHNR